MNAKSCQILQEMIQEAGDIRDNQPSDSAADNVSFEYYLHFFGGGRDGGLAKKLKKGFKWEGVALFSNRKVLSLMDNPTVWKNFSGKGFVIWVFFDITSLR